MLRADSLNVQDLLDNRHAILQMEEFIEYQKIRVTEAETELERQRRKLQEAMQERQVYEKLREKAFEAFIKEENVKEGKEVDELTSYTYGQKRR